VKNFALRLSATVVDKFRHREATDFAAHKRLLSPVVEATGFAGFGAAWRTISGR
jgi:hypothetical protein